MNMVLEYHLGHKTYADNLRAAAGTHHGLQLNWNTVTYSLGERSWQRVPLLQGVAATRAGRQEVHSAIRQRADVNVFNTQVPVAIGGRKARSAPYVVITDITPRQYDEMADAYGHKVDRLAPLRWTKHWMNERVFREASCCVGWSNWTAASIVADYGADAQRVEVVPPGVDLVRWRPGGRPEDGTVRILFVGADFERKGGGELLEAFAALPERTELVVVTKSPVRRSDRIRVVDDVGPNDPRLVDLFRSSDIFALPTHGEAFGIAAVEASAAGLPVVASGVGGLRDIVLDGETGSIVPPGDGRALANALQGLVDDGDGRRRMGAAARQHAESRFDAGRNAQRLFDLARSCVTG